MNNGQPVFRRVRTALHTKALRYGKFVTMIT